MNTVLRQFGSYLARYLTRPRDNYEQFSVLNKEQLDQTLEPGDLLLVEGNSRVSTAIKYLTQSTWSHVCMYVGPGEDGAGLLVEADVVEGVIRSPLSKYIGFNVRVCRAVKPLCIRTAADPTRAICSTLIAQAFQSIRYPILPQSVRVCRGDAPAHCDDVLLESTHFSHFTPRDFDLSPYFEIVKPTIKGNFDYRKIRWFE
ncbi:MAG: lipo-like protein [Haliea sp.]|nr:lipo-like protein [Haliea sp.]